RLLAPAVLLFFLISVPALAATSQLKVIRYAEDGSTILNQTAVTYQWMRDNLPVQGDGTTHYYHQGPVFVDDANEGREQELRWNPEEDTNVQEKDMGAVQGTDLKDLCNLAGGIMEGETVILKASDGLSRPFAYGNIYNPSSRQGKMVITWYVDGLAAYPARSYPDNGYSDGMRLVFLADSSTNPWGVHVFGNWDWHESAEEEYWYYYYGSPTEKYPTTTGLSVKLISEVQLMTDDEAVGNIRVTSTPAGAAILIDDSDSGQTTNGTITDLEIGTHTVRVALDGYREVDDQEAEVQWGVPSIHHFTLVQMEGSVEVTSTPVGAKVYLDSVDSGKVTPCTLTAVAAGDHTVTAKLTGYTDATDTVTVEDGETADLDLLLEVATSSRGTTEGGTEGGGTLTTRAQGVVYGGVLLVNATGPARVLDRGASGSTTLKVDLPPNASAKVARLYVYTTQAPNEGGVTGDGPFVAIGGKEILPQSTYQDCHPGETLCNRTETRAWDLLAQGGLKAEVPITVRHPGGQAGKITWYGATIIVAYEREGDPETGYWIAEGADAALADLDLSLPESTSRTSAEFAGEVNRARVQGARVLVISTRPPGDSGAGHQVLFNDNEWVAPLAGDGIRSATLEVRPYLKGSGNRAILESMAENRRGELLENRNAVLVVEYGDAVAGETQVPEVTGNLTAVETVMPVVPVTTGISAPAETGTIPPEPAVNDTTGTRGEGTGSILGSLFQIILSLFAGILGVEPAPAEAIPTHVPSTETLTPHAAPSPVEATPTPDPGARYNLTVTSSPRRALVYLDGEFQGKVTPVTLTGLTPGPHVLRLEMPDWKPAEEAVNLRADISVHVNLSSVYTEYAKLRQSYDEIQDGAPDRCGGVFVE
ncbi:MAG: PEGA domain-containing protein, partial [Methanomicrobiales archaeon]|nr:PEGA domain-containing protein [Methanomicrobiales archaeon]